MGLPPLLCLIVCVSYVVAPPPNRHGEAQPPGGVPPHPDDENDDQGMFNLSYQRYLMEVVKVLEQDDEFQKKLTSYGEDYIKSGKIADHVDELGPGIRSKLTQIKMKEIERLREAVQKQIEKDGGAQNIDFKQLDHIDHSNVKSFEKDDLKKLIVKTVGDLEVVDKQRKEEFKEYEMKKEIEKKHKLNAMDEEHRKQKEKEFEEAQKRHKKHPELNHPGSKDQLEEVWEESDHMEKDAFDPRTFFYLHDLDGNGFWDELEIEALFQKELDKVYNDTDPDDDPRERIEEMNRMREHVVAQMDKNKDRMISIDEFMQDTETDDYKKGEGWDTVDDQQIYTDEELRRFEEEYAKAQGWEYPYPTPPPMPDHRQEHPNQQPIQQQQQQQHPQQPIQQQPIQQQQQQQHQQPIQQQQQHQQPNPAQQQQDRAASREADKTYGI